MKIIVPAIGSRGDVQPFIALCQGLKEAGHQVTLATNPTLCSLVESYGVPVAPIGPPVDMGSEGAKIWAKAGRNWWLGFLRIMQLGFRLVQEAYPDLLELVKDTDLVVATDTFAGPTEADQLGRPWISVTLQPGRVPVKDPKISPLGRAMFAVVNYFSMAPINRFRKKVGAAPLHDLGSMLSSRMVLIPVSPHVSPPDPRWPGHVHLTGYWFARSPATWTPPPDLQEFLETSERRLGETIAVSLGAMSLSGEYTRQAAMITLEAVHLAGVRAVIQGWDEALAGVSLPPSVFHAGSLPHTWLFPRVQAVAHHGGFGTTSAALVAGVPAVVIPHIIDQTYWAQKVTELGAGPQYIHRADLTAERLAEAFRRAIGDRKIREKAAALGEYIQSEPDGVRLAVGWIEKLAA
jgi:UDP:flavonoid glycosyltransferase YjiC (YdhE family)